MDSTLLIIVVIALINVCVSLEVIYPESISGIYYHIPGNLGPGIDHLHYRDAYRVVLASPDLGGCTALSRHAVAGNVVLILRGSSKIKGIASDPDDRCTFATKVYNAQQAGAVGVVVGNDNGDHEIVPMYRDSDNDQRKIIIPAMSVSHVTYTILKNQIRKGEHVLVKVNNNGAIGGNEFDSTVQRWVTAILSTLMLLASVSLIIAAILSLRILIQRFRIIWQTRQRRMRADRIPTVKYSSSLIIAKDRFNTIEIDEYDDSEDDEKHINIQKTTINEEQIKLMTDLNVSDIDGLNQSHSDEINVLHNETCNVCLEDFKEGESIKLLRCKHGFHDKCIKTWIVKKGKCPVCIRDVFSQNNDNNNYDNDENEENSMEEYDDIYLLRL